MDKVSSLYSQLTGGIIQQAEFSSVTSGDSRNLRNYNFKIFKHDAGSIKSESQTLKESRVSHHDLYNDLEVQLFEAGYTAEIGKDVTKEQILSGDAQKIFSNILCIKTEGWAVLEDYDRLTRIAENYNEIVLLINKSIESSLKETAEYKIIHEKIESEEKYLKNIKNKGLRQKKKQELDGLKTAFNDLVKQKGIDNIDEWIIDGMKKWINVFLPRIINFRLYPFDDLESFHILANLKREFFLDNDTESIHFLYGSKPTVKLSMLGIITSAPAKEERGFDPMSEFADVEIGNENANEQKSIEKAFRGVFRGFDGFEEIVRTCRYPRLMVHPVAIYRSMKPNKSFQRPGVIARC